MNSFRRWLYRPKKSDTSLLAQFFFNDEELNAVAAELDSFDGRKDPERCAELVNKLRACQDRVLTSIQLIMAEAIPELRTSRDFRVKFPDDVVQENLAGQLWFGAECLAAGSSIMNREEESTSMRPLARALTKNLDSLRCSLREQCIQNINEYSERIREALVIFDKLFAEFELSYVSAMVPVKTRKEYEVIQEITVLFSETVQRALKQGHLTSDMIDEYDPALMFTIPRLAIVCGLLVHPEGPLNPDNTPTNMSDMFRPFQPLLFKIRELLTTLTSEELYSLEHALCTSEGPPLLTVLEGQVSSSDNACQTDFDPSSPTKVLGGGTLQSLPLPRPSLLAQDRGRNFGHSVGTETPDVSGRNHLSVPAEAVEEPAAESSSPAAAAVGVKEGEAGMEFKEKKDGTVQEEEESERAEGRGRNEDGEREEGEEGGAVEDENREALEEEENCDAVFLEGTACLLNKSESNDSGLHSENTSNSDSIFTVSSSDSQQTLNLSESAVSSPMESPMNGIDSDENNRCQDEPKIQDGTAASLRGNGGACCDLEEPVCRDAECADADQMSSKDVHGCSNCHRSAGDEANFDGARSSGEDSGVQAEGLECQAALRRDVEGQCVHSPAELTNIQLPCSDSHTATPFPDNTNAGLPAECEPRCPVQPSASLQPSDSLSHAGEDDGILVKVLEKDCVFSAPSSAGTDDADTHEAHFVKEPESVSQVSEEETEDEGNESEEETCSSTATSEDRDGSDEDAEDGGNDEGKEQTEGESPDVQELEGESFTVAEISMEGLSVGDLTSMENLIAGTMDLNGNRSVPPPCPAPIQAQVGGVALQGEGDRLRDMECLQVPRVQHLRYAESCSSCSSVGSARSNAASEGQWEKESIASSETSSYNSECRDDEEIALAIQAAEMASRNEARMRFRSSSDMIHRLFVVISGVADQLQTNFASDLRHILRAVFDMNCSEPLVSSDHKDHGILPSDLPRRRPRPQSRSRPRQLSRAAPEWVPDEQCTHCMACRMAFTFVRRRHHCRNCGNIYCSRCSSNFVPLPQFGHNKPVRVCNRCFMFQVTAFTMSRPSR